MNVTPSLTDGERAAQRSGIGDARDQLPEDMHQVAMQPMRPPFWGSAPKTFRDAAARTQATAPRVRDRMLAYLIGRGPCGVTDDEGERALGLKSQSYTPRRRERVKLGLVTNSGARRAADSGRLAVVCVVMSGGQARCAR